MHARAIRRAPCPARKGPPRICSTRKKIPAAATAADASSTYRVVSEEHEGRRAVGNIVGGFSWAEAVVPAAPSHALTPWDRLVAASLVTLEPNRTLHVVVTLASARLQVRGRRVVAPRQLDVGQRRLLPTARHTVQRPLADKPVTRPRSAPIARERATVVVFVADIVDLPVRARAVAAPSPDAGRIPYYDVFFKIDRGDRCCPRQSVGGADTICVE